MFANELFSPTFTAKERFDHSTHQELLGSDRTSLTTDLHHSERRLRLHNAILVIEIDGGCQSFEQNNDSTGRTVSDRTIEEYIRTD